MTTSHFEIHMNQAKEIQHLKSELFETHKQTASLLRLITDIRFALKDNGTRMQKDLIAYCKELVSEKPNVEWPNGYDETMGKAIEKWGVDSQWHVAVGECGEFVALTGLQAEGRLTLDKVIDEVADVTIMMRQMANIYGVDAVNERIKFKLDRLSKMINGGKNAKA
jgi:hypothetical protein